MDGKYLDGLMGGKNDAGNPFSKDDKAMMRLFDMLMQQQNMALPKWATQRPQNGQQLMRQLSANAGQMAMPGGYVGAVRMPPAGMNRHGATRPQPQMGMGQLNKYGQGPEATFYQQSTRGGMTPISALFPLGVTQGWNPFGDFQRKQKRKNDKPGGKKDDKPGKGGRPGLDDMGK